jgi:hypothetical protein
MKFYDDLAGGFTIDPCALTEGHGDCNMCSTGVQTVLKGKSIMNLIRKILLLTPNFKI